MHERMELPLENRAANVWPAPHCPDVVMEIDFFRVLMQSSGEVDETAESTIFFSLFAHDFLLFVATMTFDFETQTVTFFVALKTVFR